MSDLKVCSFCGRIPDIEDCGEHRWFIRCKCGIAQDKLFFQKCDAVRVRAWNKRKELRAKDTNVPITDTISRQAAIEVLSLGKEILSRVLDDIDVVGTDREKYSWGLGLIESNIKDIEELPPAQPEKRTEERTETHACDLTDRQVAIDVLEGIMADHPLDGYEDELSLINAIRNLSPVQPEQDREFMKLTVRNSNGRPYYSIIYLEFDDNGIGNDFEGYSSYSLDVISDYLKKYFMPSAQQDCTDCPEPYREGD